MKLVGIAGALAGYKTYTVVHKVLQAAKSFDAEVETELIDLKDYDVEFVTGTPLSYYNADTVKVVDTILAADCLVIGTPIYQASISGVLKNLLDHFPVDALHNKVTGMIASFVEKSEDNSRKVFSRAKSKISRIEGESLHYEKNKSIVNRFIEAFQLQKTDVLLELLSENVTLYSDGGGIVRAAIRPIVTLQNVSAFIFGILKKAPEDFRVEVKNVNGQPAVAIYLNGQLNSITSVFIRNDQIEEIYTTLNPDKLPIEVS